MPIPLIDDAAFLSACSRRRFLSIGSLWPLGLSATSLRAANTTASRAKRCLVIFMDGGPSHIDLWDVKPQAPVEIRGDFTTIQTSHPELPFSELLPQLSRHAHRFAIVRSVTHNIVDHNAGSYYALTGRYPVESGQLIVADSNTTFPPFGAVCAKLRPSSGPLPPFVHLAEKQFNNGFDIPGQAAGFLGAAFDPFVTGDPSLPGFAPPGLSPLTDLPAERQQRRNALRRQLESSVRPSTLNAQPSTSRWSVFEDQALELTAAPEVRAAFDLDQESPETRIRYGLDPHADRSIEARKFGGLPHLGQSMLLARRLLERGVPFITLMTGRRIDQAWDTHRQHFKLMRQSLCPPFDRALSALLTDLSERGLLDETLMVLLGEFGRTPRVGFVTSGAGATADGRDHWPYCYSVLMAGAGIQAGAIYGASDRDGAYPARDAVGPHDVAATVYRALGIPADHELIDRQGRPQVVSVGRPIEAILA